MSDRDVGLQLLKDNSPNLYSLYEGDLGDRVLSYASGSDIGKIECLSKRFQGLAKNKWKAITYKRFGMKNGKEDWIKGMSLLRNPVFIHINLAPGQPLDHTMYYAGSPHVSSNDSIIAVTTDDGMHDGAPDGIGLYDANTLSYLRSIDGGGGWGITFCGPIGAEVIVTNFSPRVLEFRRGQTTQIQRFHHNRTLMVFPSLDAKLI